MALSFIPGNMLPTPGYCLVCGADKIDCVDSGISKQFYGALLICINCFRDGALRILELDLFDRTLHANMIAELEEKIEWRKSFEPTVAKLEADISSALDRARHGFNQRYITDSPSNEVLGTFGSPATVTDEVSGLTGEVNGQLFFTLEELRNIADDARQIDDNVRDEISA